MNKTDLHSSLLFLMLKLPDVDALIKESTSDEYINKKIKDILGE